jgi:hypothetical protein
MESTKDSRKKINFGNHVICFPNGNGKHLRKFTRKWF